jgi:hypothetical protein
MRRTTPGNTPGRIPGTDSRPCSHASGASVGDAPTLAAEDSRDDHRPVPTRDPRLRESLNAVLVGSSLVVDVRQEILASWGRAARASLLPEALTIPYDPDVELASRLEREAAPVMDLLATQLAEIGRRCCVESEPGV